MNHLSCGAAFFLQDSALAAEALHEVESYLGTVYYHVPYADHWPKAWRLTDGTPLLSKTLLCAPGTPPPELAITSAAILGIALRHPEIVGAYPHAWDSLSLTASLYPRGTRLSWHTDGVYSGAMIFYAHREWSASWGGELCIAESGSSSIVRPTEGSFINRGGYDAHLMEHGIGYYIVPKPNRLVLLRGGTCHMLSRVDPDAGDHLRCTISGFFVKKGEYPAGKA